MLTDIYKKKLILLKYIYSIYIIAKFLYFILNFILKNYKKIFKNY